MFIDVKPTPRQMRETSRRSTKVESITYVYDIMMRLKEGELNVSDHLVLCYLYLNYRSSMNGIKIKFGWSTQGCFKIVHRLLDLGYIERVNAYSVILTSKGVLYIESFT